MKREPTFVFKSGQSAVSAIAGLNATENLERNTALPIFPVLARMTTHSLG